MPNLAKMIATGVGNVISKNSKMKLTKVKKDLKVLNFVLAVDQGRQDDEGNWLSNILYCSIWGEKAKSFKKAVKQGDTISFALTYQQDEGEDEMFHKWTVVDYARVRQADKNRDLDEDADDDKYDDEDDDEEEDDEDEDEEETKKKKKNKKKTKKSSKKKKDTKKKKKKKKKDDDDDDDEDDDDDDDMGY